MNRRNALEAADASGHAHEVTLTAHPCFVRSPAKKL
jgi:hypothetical protein